SLDGSQIFYLFFGGSVIIGLVFALGVMVGRRVEARGHVDAVHTAVTADPLAALDRLEGGGGLSFQGALRRGESPASDVEKKVEAKAFASAEAKKVETKNVEAKVEPKAEAKKVEGKVDA